MTFALWTLVIGVLLIVMVLSGTLLNRLPMSNAMLYLTAGFALGPAGWAVVMLNLGLPPGAAILLGAILAPPDRALASAVQVESSGDRDRLRFSLTGEGGLNDGTAFPFVMLGLGLLGLHDLGMGGWRWLAVAWSGPPPAAY